MRHADNIISFVHSFHKMLMSIENTPQSLLPKEDLKMLFKFDDMLKKNFGCKDVAFERDGKITLE